MAGKDPNSAGDLLTVVHPANDKSTSSPSMISPSPIALHGLDLFSGPVHISIHQFYHRPPFSLEVVADRLKFSLAKALALFPPAAGTVRADDGDGGKACIDMSLPCLGTPFVVAVKETQFEADTDDISPRPEVFLPTPASALAVKLTQFSCGTIALATSMHHQVSDLRGFLNFLEVWAQIARGQSVDCSRLPDDWSRTPGRFFPGLNTTTASLPTSPPPPFAVSSSTPSSTLPSFPPSAITRWKFTPNAVKQLKRDLTLPASSAAGGLYISSNDALSALLWGAIARARANAAKISTISDEPGTQVLAMAADGRYRSPCAAVASQYFGNLNILVATTASRSDLLSTTCESASHVATEIRKAVNRQLAPEAIAQKILFFEDPKNAEPPGRITFAADVVGTNWCQAHLESARFDLGWGKPFVATSGGGPLPPGFFRVMQGLESGDITVILTVEEEGLKALTEDTLLNRYALVIGA